MISSLQLARVMAVYSYDTGTKKLNGVEGIAAKTGVTPLLVINAVNKGEQQGLFTVKRTKGGIDSISVSSDQFDSIAPIASNFGEELFDYCEAVLEFVQNANSRESDISRDQLDLWSGVSPAAFNTALRILIDGGSLAQYQLGAKNDSKTSYKFLTLPENLGKKWGSKQLK